MYRIMIIEDEALLKELLIQSITQQHDFLFVGESSMANDASALCEKLQPHLVLMDIKTADGNGIDATAKIKKKYPNIKIIILTALPSETLLNNALLAGADGYALKSISIIELMTLIRHTLQGFPSTLKVNPINDKPLTTFTPIELQILQSLAEGKSSKTISEELKLSYGTVRNYISGMISRYDFNDRVHLVSFAINEGLID
jgi:DNA-binding NarL/FixJ family response regulator